MAFMKHVEKIIAIGMLVFAIGFNLWLYRLEPTAAIDPNDNTFQYALVDRTNQIWDFADKTCLKNLSPASPAGGFVLCHMSFLIDHWVPNWAQGYNLPTYYSHIPQLLIVASYRVLNFIRSPLAGLALQGVTLQNISLFAYYHFVIYLLLSLFPLTVFLSLRLIRLPWLIAGFGALIASHISTDGLYGLDPPSFLWRGYGLTSQLFAMIPLPLAIAYSWRYLTENSKHEARNPKQILNSNVQNSNAFRISNFEFRISPGLAPAVLALVATTSGHLGMGIIALLSLIPMALAKPSTENIKKLMLLGGATVFILSYWIIPVLLFDNYHNISVWDPPWKFNSYGAKEVMTRLFNGDLFDFGRLPILTVLVIVGAIASLWPKKYTSHQAATATMPISKNVLRQTSTETSFVTDARSSFAFLFLFFLLLYFGRTTWGGLIDMIPGMKEFHLSRFIVGLHAAGLFLIPIGFWETTKFISRFKHRLTVFPSYCLLFLLIIVPTYQQTIRYNELNDTLILQANANYAKAKPDAELLISELKTRIAHNPGRVFAGRGGGWGKDFRVAETPYNIFLSTYGIPTVLWLPQTWSPNSDVEQYFSEDNLSTYSLFGVRYVVAPPTAKPQPFWKLVKETTSWKLYEIPSTEYFTTGVRPAIVATDKRSYTNVIRLWIQSDKFHQTGLYPELTFDKEYPKKTGLPNFKMLDEVTYIVPDETTHNVFREPPVYIANSSVRPAILSQSVDSNMMFKAKIRVPKDCTECIVILKQSSNPNWRVTIDGKNADHFNIFPVFVGVTVPEGDHDLIFSYEPSGLKIGLLLFSGGIAILFVMTKFLKIPQGSRLLFSCIFPYPINPGRR